MAVEFTPEQQEVFNTTLAEKKKQWERKYEGYLSPDQVEEIKSGFATQIDDLNKALTTASEKVANHDKVVADLNNIIKGHELASVKSRIAHEMGLTYDAISFLQGDDEDAIKKSAESLKTLLGVGKTQPEFSRESSSGDAKKDALRKMTQNIGKN